ncbi:hypothetical protein H072_7711 [Dactylellina haptotyla CBS 200.50]|uniref:Ecp2 effector protein domain-containing protein n=1 Tax=Dactylellina haptotyla (strain CBS 200.50) TaxID=1284197 RepID=S8A6B1_DACHA|nr:hypothetical protein H072_7711 [Dactylellina haptotyla CBS 200.50]
MVAIKYALLTFSLLGAAAAAPASEVDYVSALVPGEGLPSPKELGLTNVFLQKRKVCRYTDVCQRTDAIACFNYLLGLNERSCSTGARPTQFCRMGGCSWIGQAENAPQAASYFRDVAHGGNVVINGCRIGSICAGYNYAGGNGNLRVTLAGN